MNLELSWGCTHTWQNARYSFPKTSITKGSTNYGFSTWVFIWCARPIYQNCAQHTHTFYFSTRDLRQEMVLLKIILLFPSFLTMYFSLYVDVRQAVCQQGLLDAWLANWLDFWTIISVNLWMMILFLPTQKTKNGIVE